MAIFLEGIPILVWDLPLRLFHWLLVLAITSAWITAELGGLWLDWHAHFGIFIFALMVFRITWGFMGTTYARFGSFFPTPKRFSDFFSSGWSGFGHSPLGALSVFILLGLILAQAGLGLFAMNDEIEFHGPLYDLVSSSWSERLTGWHHQLFNILAILIGMHVMAIGYYTGFKRKNLVLPMITGKVCVADDMFIPPIRGGGKIQLLFSITLAGVVFWYIESVAANTHVSCFG